MIGYEHVKLHEMINCLVGPGTNVLAVKTDALVVRSGTELLNQFTNITDKHYLTLGMISKTENCEFPKYRMLYVLPVEYVQPTELAYREDPAIPMLMDGPAGTGKTTTFVTHVLPLINSSSASYICTALSYSACDNFIQKGIDKNNVMVLNKHPF